MTTERPTDFPLSEPNYANKRVRDLGPFIQTLSEFSAQRLATLDRLLAGLDIPSIQRLMDTNDLSSEELVIYYLDRVRRYDIDKLNAVMELNPEALQIARDLDAERADRGPRSAMHGIPVLLKDNIATGDQLHTAAGAYVLRDWQPLRDAFLVRQLRASGAVVLGKANLSEWANWMDPSMPNGFSTLGGQTRHPYGPFDPFGSSSGSAVAVAADLVTVSVGTETRGSIISPAGINSIVGLKTSLGLISRDLIIPLVDWLDVPGPMGRTVTDVAVMLSAMTGTDINDPSTQRAETMVGVDFSQFLNSSVDGLRVGVLVYDDAAREAKINLLDASERDDNDESIAAAHAELDTEMDSANALVRELVAPLRDLGMDVVEISIASLPSEPDLMSVLAHGFKETLNQFLEEMDHLFLDGQTPISSLAEIVAFNQQDSVDRTPYGQGRLVESETSQLTDEDYASMVAHGHRVAGQLHDLFVSENVDVILCNAATAIYATAGFPALSVPAGYKSDGKPVGMTLMADYLGEPTLITVGHAYERATQARRAPDLDAAIGSFEDLRSTATTLND